MAFWYLSFATDDAWLGCCVVEAHDEMAAVMEAHHHDCNPGGEVLLIAIPAHVKLPASSFNRLATTEAEAEALAP